MATFLIGDVHGCFNEFCALLGKMGVVSGRDEVILLGDLVNRGPASLDVLRYCKKNESFIRVVLGNHDLFLVALQLGLIENELAKKSKKHTLDTLLLAKDAGPLISWLRHQPTVIQESWGTALHAGVLPSWDRCRLQEISAQLSLALIDDKDSRLLLPRNPPQGIPVSLRDLRSALWNLITLRVLDKRGEQQRFSGRYNAIPNGQHAWFDSHDPRWEGPIYFGHWAALGFHRANGTTCLDSGCAWGRKLMGYCIDTDTFFDVPSEQE